MASSPPEGERFPLRYLRQLVKAANLDADGVRVVSAWALADLDPPALSKLDDRQRLRVAGWVALVRDGRVSLDLLRFGYRFAVALLDAGLSADDGLDLAEQVSGRRSVLALRPEHQRPLRAAFHRVTERVAA